MPPIDPLERPSDAPPLDPEIALSVVIVNWNTKDLLRHCLQSLFTHCEGFGFEVLVVDNDSADGSSAMVQAEFPNVRLIQNEDNEGFGRASNRGMREAVGRTFLLLNSDTLLQDNAFKALLECLDAHPQAGIVGGTLQYADGRPQPSCGMFPTLSRALVGNLSLGKALGRVKARQTEFNRPWLPYEDHQTARHVEWVIGALMLVRREAAEEVGLFDERIFLFAEEWDWCYRMHTAGWEVRFTPAARIIHLGSASWTMADARLAHAQRSGMQYFMRKHYGPLKSGGYRFLTGLGGLIKTVTWLGVWLVAPSRRPDSMARVQRHLASVTWSLSRGAGNPITKEDVAPRTPSATD